MQLSQVKGIGLNSEKYLNELGIYTAEDLIEYYPFKYEILENTDPKTIKDGDKVVIGGICENKPNVFHFNRKLNKMSFRLNTGDFITNVTIFNRAFLKTKIDIGTVLTVVGKYDQKHNLITASNLKFGILTKPEITPVYHASFKINSSKIAKFIDSALKTTKVKSLIPNYLSEKYHFISKEEAVKIVHHPNSKQELDKALTVLKYEEIFEFMFKIEHLKNLKQKEGGIQRNLDITKIDEFINNLPFKLTEDQLKATKEISEDMMSSYRMNRLLQGDVGSGKTIVAVISLYLNYLSGYQGALMAPTEILAQQHYNTITKLLPNLNIVLLTGKLKSKEKREAKELISSGKANIIIGTHALISEDVTYQNLGLVITDEQHRFGVNQRSNLRNKGKSPDILYMSATPIPRTYALTLYGDMDITSIKTMPKGRKPVKTYLKSEKQITEVLYMMLDEIKKGHQIYIVAPLVEKSDKIDLENVYKLEEKFTKAFGKICKIGLMHGKLSNDEKDQVMNDFKEGKTKILISTTVIEVGVDVPKATMIIIFDSYRFGLSALHQLRGRVGRNDLDSYCILISDRETKRLEVLTKTNDGFKISEEDFKIRGGGEIFGLRQSGDMNFKLADIKNDYNMLVKVKEDAEEFIKSKKYLEPENREITEKLCGNKGLD